MPASSSRGARSGRVAWVEVLAGVAAFVVALVTWAMQLFAPLYERDGRCVSCRPRFGQVSAVDAMYGLNNLVHYYFPSLAVLILAFLLLTGLVAVGACLHGVWCVRAGRWLLWGGSLLVVLALPAVAYTTSSLPLSVRPAMPVQLLPGADTPVLGLGLGVGLAVLATVAARRMRAEPGAAEGQAAPAPRPARGRRAGRTELLTAVLACALALVTWGPSLFAPLYQDVSGCDRFGCPHLRYVSLVEAMGGLGASVRRFPGVAGLILAFLVLTGVMALGAALHGARRVRAGRWLVWGASVPLPIAVSGLATLYLLSVPPIPTVAMRPVLPYLWLGYEGIAGTDVLVLVAGPSLCLGSAVVAALAAARAEGARSLAHG